MTIFAIDDEKLALEGLLLAIQEAVPNANIHGFSKVQDLLSCIETTSCDVAFLDIEMRETSGLILAKQLQEINPAIHIVFVTGYSQYATDAFKLRASGYVLKPATKEKIEQELKNIA